MDKTEKTAKELIDVVKELRKKCPWDKKQTHKSLAKYLQEEAVEVIDAIYSEDASHLKKELGDLLFQILIHSVIAEENGNFSFYEVMDSIKNKMINRHPHVFGGENKNFTESELRENWEKKKKQENGGKKEKKMEEIAKLEEMPFNQRALFIQNYASRQGFDWENVFDIIEKLTEEVNELKDSLKKGKREEIEEEIGDIILVITNICRFLKIDYKKVSERALLKFARRFDLLKKEIESSGRRMTDMNIEELEELWQKLKNKI